MNSTKSKPLTIQVSQTADSATISSTKKAPVPKKQELENVIFSGSTPHTIQLSKQTLVANSYHL